MPFCKRETRGTERLIVPRHVTRLFQELGIDARVHLLELSRFGFPGEPRIGERDPAEIGIAIAQDSRPVAVAAHGSSFGIALTMPAGGAQTEIEKEGDK